MQSRLPRFKRSTEIVPMLLTERDRSIIRLVHRHRFLRSSQILALMGNHSQQILRRLQLLYHHGFLERPRAQIEYYRQGGSRHIIYGLGNRGASLLKQERGVTFRSLPWGEKNRAVGRLFFDHALLISDVMVAIELACRKLYGVRLLSMDEFPVKNARPSKVFKWNVKMDGHVKLGIVPDQVFAIEFADKAGNHSPVLLFLEADRGTMPVIRKNLSQTSFYRKLLAYEATWSQGLHRSLFGFLRFRVLTVTTGPVRVKSLVDACSQLKSGHGLFLFADQGALQKHGEIFTFPWMTGRVGETDTLLN